MGDAVRGGRRRWRRWLVVAAGLVALLLAIGIVVLEVIDYGPGNDAKEALASDGTVEVTLDGAGYTLEPVEPSGVGLVFYPGGLVDPRAYAAHLRPLAEAGHVVVVVDPPLDLAVLDPDQAADVMDNRPDVDRWVVGGHSLGGAMAARFANRNDEVSGLVLWAAFPADDDDLRGRPIAVTSIYGTEDGLSSPEEVLAAADRLPTDARFVEIVGGNHAQFGDYGAQRGDGEATITPLEQREQVVEATVALLDAMRR